MSGGTAVILAPGGLPGIEAHVGAWLACEERGIRPSWIGGCSAGAIVGALWAAGRLTASAAAAYVSSLRSEDLVRKRLAWKARAFWLDSFCDPAPVRDRLEDLLPESFADLQIPLTVSATRMAPKYAEAAHFTRGVWLREAVQASSSIAGVWPYVLVAGQLYSDGGTTDAIVLPERIEEYDRIIVVCPTRLQDFRQRDRNLISRLLWNVEALAENEVTAARHFLQKHFHDRVIWIDVGLGDTSCLQFSAGHALIQSARSQAARWLQAMCSGQAPSSSITPGAPATPATPSAETSPCGAGGDQDGRSSPAAVGAPGSSPLTGTSLFPATQPKGSCP